MTSQRQAEANRRNCLLSTGPKTEEGKQRSRQNAIKHGLTAETVVVGLEDVSSYRAFETEILNEYEPHSVVERELTLRLASLVWRLRRASLIETGLLQFHCKQSSICDDPDSSRRPCTPPSNQVGQLIADQSLRQDKSSGERADDRWISDGDILGNAEGSDINKKRMTHAFLQLVELGTTPFERIGRYEAALWRQFVQTLFALDEAKRHRLVASRQRFTPFPPQW